MKFRPRSTIAAYVVQTQSMLKTKPAWAASSNSGTVAQGKKPPSQGENPPAVRPRWPADEAGQKLIPIDLKVGESRCYFGQVVLGNPRVKL